MKISPSKERPAIIGRMPRTDMYFKIVIEHDEEEDVQKIGAEISRQLGKLYVVREAEMSSYVTQPQRD